MEKLKDEFPPPKPSPFYDMHAYLGPEQPFPFLDTFQTPEPQITEVQEFSYAQPEYAEIAAPESLNVSLESSSCALGTLALGGDGVSVESYGSVPYEASGDFSGAPGYEGGAEGASLE